VQIRLTLSAYGPAVDVVRAEWLASGGELALLGGGPGFVQLVAIDGTEAGRRLVKIATAAGDPSGATVNLARVAQFDASDFDRAELFDLGVGDVSRILDERSVSPRAPCESCGLPLPRSPVASGLRLRRGAKAPFDLFSEHGQWLASAALAEALVALAPTQVAVVAPLGDGSGFSHLSPCVDLGWQANGTEWSAPCVACGLRRGRARADFVMGLRSYARSAAKTGVIAGSSDGTGSLFVPPRVRDVLFELRWRYPKGELAFRPVQLVDTEPILQ
jgi:hypothetical protein